MSFQKTAHKGSAMNTPLEHEPPRPYLQIFSWTALLFFMGSLTHLMGSSDGESGPLSALYQPIAAALYIFAMVVLAGTARFRRQVSSYFRDNYWMTVSLAVVLASTLWSFDPALTARKSIAVVATTLTGVLIGLAYSRSDLTRFLRNTYLLFIFASFLVSVLLPQYGVHHDDIEHEGRWRGLMGFKNQMAWAAVLFLLVWIGKWRLSSLLRPAQMIPFAMGIIVLIMCGSATGILQFVFGAAVLLCLRMYFRNRSFRILFAMLLILGASILAASAQSLLALFLESSGRSETLSGRTVIWAEVWPYILQKPWLGWGQSAFWSDPTRFFGNYFWVGTRNHSHNAYIEVLLDLGLIGLIIQMSFMWTLFQSLWRAGKEGHREAPILLAVMASLMLTGVAGAMFFRPNTGTWVLICMISAYCHARFGYPKRTRRTVTSPTITTQSYQK